MHPLFHKADVLSREVIGAAIEVHRNKGPGLIESIYERCLMRELELRKIAAVNQRLVRIEYKKDWYLTSRCGLTFSRGLPVARTEAAQEILPVHKAQLFSYMKLLNVPIGLIINFHEEKLVDGIVRMMLPGANR